jgi:hypothetical protein
MEIYELPFQSMLWLLSLCLGGVNRVASENGGGNGSEVSVCLVAADISGIIATVNWEYLRSGRIFLCLRSLYECQIISLLL